MRGRWGEMDGARIVEQCSLTQRPHATRAAMLDLARR